MEFYNCRFPEDLERGGGGGVSRVSIFHSPFYSLDKNCQCFQGYYYHLRSTVKRELFSHMFIFQTRQFPRQLCRLDQLKMFRLGHETMNVCQRNVACFGHMECMFDNINDIFQGFGRLV